MSRAGLTIIPRLNHEGDVGWSVVNTGQPASEAHQWQRGEKLDFAEVSWLDASAISQTDPTKARGQRITVIRSIHVGDWVLVRYQEGKMSGQEFAKVCAIRMCATGSKKTCRVLVSWGYSIENAAVENRGMIAKAVMQQAGLTDDCMVVSDHFDIVGQDMVDDVVMEKPDIYGVIATVDYGLHKGQRVMVDIMDDGLWLAVTDRGEDDYYLKTGKVLQEGAIKTSAHL
ncbi:hypothetical protein BDZ85DRAFT_102457 [Elsinoe ampelina]|uniref:Uncharacterized protein n=1 Tax=Elsinoe ampelina TaxID=302913 RepID=A0A6A6GFG0_9PEZI|nr:hypothetical protein BDZ85DRAFT_102457 [Elsinoe ampelina]